MIFAAETINYISLFAAAGALLASLGSFLKAPAERDATKRSISVDEAAEIRQTLALAVDVAQEERDGARAEARLLRKEVQECHGQCDQIQVENSELKQKNQSLERRLERADRKIELLDQRVAELTAQLEALR